MSVGISLIRDQSNTSNSTMSTEVETFPVDVNGKPLNRNAARRRWYAGRIQTLSAVISINLFVFVLYSLGTVFVHDREFSSAIKRWLIFLTIHISANIFLAFFRGISTRGRRYAISAIILLVIAFASGGEAALRAFGI